MKYKETHPDYVNALSWLLIIPVNHISRHLKHFFLENYPYGEFTNIFPRGPVIRVQSYNDY